MTGEPRAPAPQELARRGGLGLRWEAYWFGESSLCRLGAFRMILMAAAYYAAWHFSFGVFQHADGVAPRFLNRVWNPIYAFDVLGLQPPGPATARTVYTVLVTSIALGFCGLFTRLSTAVVALLSFYWIGTAYSFGKPHHDCISLMFGLAVLPFAPVGGRLSLDSLIARIRAARRGGSIERPSVAAYAALPLRLTMVTGALSYFFAGASKLVIAGFGWMNGYTLQGIMLEYRSDWSGPLSGNILLLQLMSVGLIIVQTTFPIALFSTWSRWFYVPMGVTFHLIAMKTMATGPFLTLWFTLAAFIPLERIPGILRAGLGSGTWIRRLVLALLFCGVTYGILLMYMPHKSPWLLLIVLPIVLSVPYLILPQLHLELCFAARARGWAALVRALDWGGCVDVREGVDASPASISFTAIALRLPLLVPIAPLVLLSEKTGLIAGAAFFKVSNRK